ncbi:MAG: DUF374 domain-containing protein [Hyphomicrobiales bacterium]|nr:DUF374 domain-containing protein [Hyphomicrobiales bacterium]
MLKAWGQSPAGHALLGRVLAYYLDFTDTTTRYAREPQGSDALLQANLPCIFAFWHGQNAFLHRFLPRDVPLAVLISRHGDGGIASAMLNYRGIETIRGSGGPPQKARRHGGVAAMRGMMRALAQGTSVAISADVPKVSRHAGLGVITLAQISGRPIVPIALAVRNRINFRSWDRAALALPFGPGAVVVGEPRFIDRRADAASLEASRRDLEHELDRIQARAYGMVRRQDPGADLVIARENGASS